MNIRRIRVGKRLSEICIFNNIVYLAGQVPENTIEKGIEDQTKEVLNMIENLLLDIGSDKTNILQTQIFLKNIQDIHAMNKVWDAWVIEGATPARATVQALLADSRWLIEMVVVAAVPGSGYS